MFVREAWYVCAWSDELTATPVARRICGDPIVLYRDRAGKASALEDRCCHRALPLSAGTVVENGLQCGYHGMTFASDGACVDVPGQSHISAKSRVRAYPIAEQDAMVWIWMGEPAHADASTIVTFPYHNDAQLWPSKHTMYPLAANAMLVIDNLMDATHLGYVHATTIGGNPKAHVNAIFNVVPSDTGLSYSRWLLNCATPPTHAKAVPALGEFVDRWQEFEFIAPASIRQWSGSVSAGTGAYENGRRDGGFSIRLFHSVTPETETSCLYFWSTSIGYRQSEPQAAVDAFNEVAKAFDEDKVVVELQQMRMSETSEDRLVNNVADGARVQMRRVVDKMLLQEQTLPAAVFS